MIIANHGATRAHIIVADDASAATLRAASELSRYIFKMTGANMTVHPVSRGIIGNGNAAEICVGLTGRDGEPDISALKNDGFILKTVGSRLFILGENDRAVLHAVYAFLEDELGCRFFTDTVEHIPQRSYLAIGEIDRTVISPFEYREIYGNVCFDDDDYATKRGLNGMHYKLNAERGGSLTYQGFVHTFNYYVPVFEFFEEHPEYFSMVDGKRFDGGDDKYEKNGCYMVNTQLCLSNSDVLRIVTERLRKEIEAHPEAKIFSISQSDWGQPCRCPACSAIDEEEGSYSGSIVRFINKVAENIAEDYPDVIIDTLAYSYSRTAPKLTSVAPNVAIRLCTIECCFSHPLRTCNEAFRSRRTLREGNTVPVDLQEWGKKSNRIYVWDYNTNFHHYFEPMPNFHVLQDNIKFFIENNVVGLFEQGNGEDLSGEFNELRYYIISKLMWEPDGDVDRWMREFMIGYYGMGAQPLREYIDALREHVEKENVHVHISNHPAHGHLPSWLLDLADAKFDEAERLAENEEILERIRRSRMQIKYCRLFNLANDPDVDDVKYAVECEKFLADVNHFGFARIREGYLLEDTSEKIRNRDFGVR
ncbi:MAG: DUF4838 domain-containing protein [Clostridia bacterium]|nr:DUF4838 domain-containing protein [Clostridia bacterium]